MVFRRLRNLFRGFGGRSKKTGHARTSVHVEPRELYSAMEFWNEKRYAKKFKEFEDKADELIKRSGQERKPNMLVDIETNIKEDLENGIKRIQKETDEEILTRKEKHPNQVIYLINQALKYQREVAKIGQAVGKDLLSGYQRRLFQRLELSKPSTPGGFLQVAQDIASILDATKRTDGHGIRTGPRKWLEDKADDILRVARDEPRLQEKVRQFERELKTNHDIDLYKLSE